MEAYVNVGHHWFCDLGVRLVNEARKQFALETAKVVINGIGLEIEALEIVGSTFISDKTTSDVDVLVRCKNFDKDEITLRGWEYGGSVGLGNDDWASWKRTFYVMGTKIEVNLLVTASVGLYHDWLTAADVCRFLHLAGVHLTRGQVHGVHSLIMNETDLDADTLKRWDYA